MSEELVVKATDEHPAIYKTSTGRLVAGRNYPREEPHWPPREDLPQHPGLPYHPAKFHHRPPPPDEVKILLTYNQFHLEEGRIYQFVTSVSGPAWAVGPFYYNLFNLGPGHIFYRGYRNPSERD